MIEEKENWQRKKCVFFNASHLFHLSLAEFIFMLLWRPSIITFTETTRTSVLLSDFMLYCQVYNMPEIRANVIHMLLPVRLQANSLSKKMCIKNVFLRKHNTQYALHHIFFCHYFYIFCLKLVQHQGITYIKCPGNYKSGQMPWELAQENSQN